MSVVLVGGVSLSRTCLERLAANGIRIALAVGYSERLASRSGYVSMREVAEKYRIPLFETDDINGQGALDAIRRSRSRLMVVTGWSQLIRRPLLDACPLGAVGIHPTRLPEGRGRAPIPWTLIKGLTRSAVSLFHLTEGADEGDIVAQEEFDIALLDDAETLYGRISGASVELLRAFVPLLLAGSAPRIAQDHSKATYWPRRRPEDGVIDWAKPGLDVYNWIRALTHPFPGAFTTYGGEHITIWRAGLVDWPGAHDRYASAGTIVGVEWSPDGGGLVVRCGDGRLLLAKRLRFRDAEWRGAEILAAGHVSVGGRFGTA